MHTCVQTIDSYALTVAGNLLHASHFENQCDWRTFMSHTFWCCVWIVQYWTSVAKWCNLLLTATNLCVNTEVSKLSIFSVVSTTLLILWQVFSALARGGLLVGGCIPSRWNVLRLITSFVFVPLLLRQVSYLCLLMTLSLNYEFLRRKCYQCNFNPAVKGCSKLTGHFLLKTSKWILKQKS